MNDRLRPLIAALRMLAKQTNPLYERLVTAERAIVDHLSTVDGTATQPELRRLHEVARTEANEAKKRPSETDFWISVKEYIDSKLLGP